MEQVKKVKAVKENNYFESVGRRKGGVARVRIYLKNITIKGKALEKGAFIINEKSVSDIYTKPFEMGIVLKPLAILEAQNRYIISVKVTGGGPTGQLEAIVLGVARALEKVDPTYRPTLKTAGLLTRDPRIKERRKVGTGGKARRAKQSPKR
jgi:small subunit ribosomal protein S9